MTLRCALADDEFLATQLLTEYIRKTPDLELAGTFHNPVELLAFLQHETVDVLFLDIQMPDLTGLDVIRLLKQKPAIVLTTAYAEYAVQSYELDVADYLLKPITFERFFKSILKIREQLNRQMTAFKVPENTLQPEKKHLWIKADYKTIKIPYEDILYIEGLKEYVQIHTKSQKYITLAALKQLEESLSDGHFARIHKSYIAGLDHVTAVVGNQLEIRKSLLPIGANYKEQVMTRLQKG